MARDGFFSDRERGVRARTIEEITPPVWAGIASVIRTRVRDNRLAKAFPLHCPDGNSIVETDEDALLDHVSAVIPGITFPPERDDVPPLLDAST